jgi:hypothetical protein
MFSTQMTGGSQKIAVAAGFTSPIWPVVIRTGKVVVLGLDETAAKDRIPADGGSGTP